MREDKANERFCEDVMDVLRLEFGRDGISDATTRELYFAVSKAAIACANASAAKKQSVKRASYFSAEFLIGRLIYDNLLNLGLTQDARTLLGDSGVDLGVFEEVEDAALGNGGLGRLAACFLDSAATHSIALDGYGIRYRYGLFKQFFEDGFQREMGDDWQRFGDPWSVRRDDEWVTVTFADGAVKAVPYDMPVIGYGGKCVNRLRLWQAEAMRQFDFDSFNRNEPVKAFEHQLDAEKISAVLYPNDETEDGKKLRLRQQYFFSSASIQDLVKRYKAQYGSDFSAFAEHNAIQLNDTHPVVSIPELMRILVEEEGVDTDEAFDIARDTFAYTNHTVLSEALEMWSRRIFFEVIPQVYDYIVFIDHRLRKELSNHGIAGEQLHDYLIIDSGTIHMARLAVYTCHSTNGVAKLHTQILKDDVLHKWYKLFPERLNNKTNGITQRRWLALCNPELSAFITERIGDRWITELDDLKKLEAYKDDSAALREFACIKQEKKRQLCAYIKAHDGIELDDRFVFDIQVKRLHEYKRQLLNAFSILDIYFGIKSGRIIGFTPTAFIFGAKAAPGYYRAKGIIKFINEIARLVDSDPEVSELVKVVFVANYNVSYAEKLMPAADISEQISTAGTEASGTGNMKLMLNGAVTLGTYDGANVEIVAQAGEDNNYIFGARVEEIERLKDGNYDAQAIYDSDERVRRVVDTLIDGTLDDGGTGMFRELYDALLQGASWHKPDHYFLLLDFTDYCDTKLRCIADYNDREAFTRKALLNTANAGMFSSDRTIKQYAQEIWGM